MLLWIVYQMLHKHGHNITDVLQETHFHSSPSLASFDNYIKFYLNNQVLVNLIFDQIY